MATNTAEVTFRVVDPLTVPKVAVIALCPAATPLASPLTAIVATVATEGVQLTELVRFCWLPSLKVPVAVNCCVVPAAMVGLAGVTVMEESVAVVTVKPVDPCAEPSEAEIVVFPLATEVAIPPGLTVATPVFELLQLAELVKSWMLVSLYVPAALNCWESPGASEEFAGLTAIDCRVGLHIPPLKAL